VPAFPREAIETAFPNEPEAVSLLEAFFRQRRYSRRLALRCLKVARGGAGQSWELRRTAVLLLENCLLRIRPHDSGEFALILGHLGIDPDKSSPALKEELSKQGFSNLQRKGFIAEFRRRLRRLEYAHREIDGGRGHPDSLRRFLTAASRECHLLLARYIFKPEEVAARILSQVTVSEGCLDVRARERVWFDGESEDWLASLPAYEASILKAICSDASIYWVSEATGSELNSLVEYPLTSAVLTIKPPGSEVEFEIKRAGLRGTRLLNVVFERNGKPAPVSHWLFGASFGWLGVREAQAASVFSRIYRRVHGSQVSSCMTMAIRSVLSVPCNGSQTHILDYLTSPDAFGSEFDSMRGAVRECADRLPPDTGVQSHPYKGPVGLTLQFIAQAKPQQAVLLNTSSFRLDRIELYLSDAGPAAYFEQGLRVSYTSEDAARLADEVLLEVLGVYTRPRVAYRGQEHYVRAALSLRGNRKRADRNFCEIMGQIGEFWGTLLGVRGYTDGESFVVRNAGLRTVWSGGDWRIRIIFMDHDDLFILGKRKLYFWPNRAVLGMYRDETHIMGGPMKYERIKGEVGALQAIFRVEEDVYRQGLSALTEALRLAYERTLRAVETDPYIQEFFFEPFWRQIRDWDEVVRIYLEGRDEHRPGWWARAGDFLRSKAYDEPLIDNYLKTVETYRDFFERNHFLYQAR
jgi:hypothetical protein